MVVDRGARCGDQARWRGDADEYGGVGEGLGNASARRSGRWDSGRAASEELRVVGERSRGGAAVLRDGLGLRRVAKA
ncbi:MAG: hypothetical protein IPK85_04850 [Gemmatimonadetes bacterium]|nr:hypothetical protein [Gemmatimonadota bacterium]